MSNWLSLLRARTVSALSNARACQGKSRRLEREAHARVLEHWGRTEHVQSERLDEEYWLERAREAYALVGQMAYPEAKRQMLEIAATYQRLAQSTQERNGRTKPRST